jgi:hypothetical protein
MNEEAPTRNKFTYPCSNNAEEEEKKKEKKEAEK